MMINIVENVFLSNQYKKLELNISFDNALCEIFYPNESAKKEEYYVVLQLIDESVCELKALLDEKAQSLFEAIIETGKVARYFEKNCTLLICHNEKNIDLFTILNIEEDVYNFKKNIITYTDNELDQLKNYIHSANINNISCEVLREIINDNEGETFIDFKNTSMNCSTYYSLVMKLFIKLPFLTYSKKIKDLEDLDVQIKNQLTTRQNILLNELVSIGDEWSNMDIHEVVTNIWGEKND